MGFNPLTLFSEAIKATGAATSMFDVFGPTEAFQARQAIRDEYLPFAQALVRTISTLAPGDLKTRFSPYLSHIDAVIARGAVAADLSEIRTKTAELQAAMVAGAAAGNAFDVAGLPWYVWLIAAGVLLPMVIKKK